MVHILMYYIIQCKMNQRQTPPEQRNLWVCLLIFIATNRAQMIWYMLVLHPSFRGFGTIRFSCQEDAASAIEKMNNTDLDGRRITVHVDRYAWGLLVFCMGIVYSSFFPWYSWDEPVAHIYKVSMSYWKCLFHDVVVDLLWSESPWELMGV